MNGRTIATLTLVSLATLACADQGGEEEAAAQMEQAADTMAEMAGQPQRAANRVDLAAKNESGVTGTVAWSVSGDSVTFTVSLAGLTGGEQYPVHVHQGSCEAGGGVAAPLDAVTGGSGGAGESSGTVARGAFEAGGSYFVQAHLADGTPAACGDLPSDAGLAAGGGGDM